MSLTLDIALNAIKTKKNYRKTFNEKSLAELRASITQHGVIEPIVVRRDGDGFQLIAGERRVRAAELAGLVTIPARILDVSEQKVLELQLIENIQRDNVPFFEEAVAIRRLRDEQALDVKEIAKKLGKSETYTYFQLSVTNLPDEAKDACEKGELTKAVAWLIARIKEPGNQIKAANDLRRTQKSKLITERTARQYISGHVRRGRPEALQDEQKDSRASRTSERLFGELEEVSSKLRRAAVSRIQAHRRKPDGNFGMEPRRR